MTTSSRPPPGPKQDADPGAPSGDDRDPGREARALDEAWRDIIHARHDDEERAALTDRPLISVLFAAIVGGPYEGAEIDPPSIAVLRAVRVTIDGWARARSGSTMFASVPFADLALLARRLDAAIEIVRRSAIGAQGGAR
jgi:hypothetical protein